MDWQTTHAARATKQVQSAKHLYARLANVLGANKSARTYMTDLANPGYRFAKAIATMQEQHERVIYK